MRSPGVGAGISGDRVTNTTTTGFTGGPWTFTRTAVASSAETIATWKLSDDSTSNIIFKNSTTTDGTFGPHIQMQVTGSSLNNLQSYEVQTDSGTAPAITWRAQTIAGAALATRPAFQWNNWTTTVAQITASPAFWVSASPGVSGGYKIGTQVTYTHTSSSRAGFEAQSISGPSGASSGVTYGTLSQSGTASGNGQNHTSTVGLIGVSGDVIHRGTATVTGVACLYANGISNTGGGTIMNGFGLYIPTLSGATNTFGIYTGNNPVRFGGSQINALRVATTTPITVSATTDNIVVSQLAAPGAVAVNLPASPTVGLTYTIKDGTGDAAANNITITPAAGNIDGAGTLVLAANYAVAKLVYNGTQWNRVGS